MEDQEQITYFAETDARGKRVPFGIKAKDRTKHVYVIGKTGMGKSTMLENMAIQDIRNGNGFTFIDPHGKTADLLLEYIPEERKKDVLYFAPFDLDHPIAFNVMEDVGQDKRHLVVSGLMSAFKKIWVDAWSARMEYILSNTILALLEYPDATLLSINRMYTDKVYRKKVVDNVTDATVKSFWVDEFAKYTDRFAAEATPSIQNKIGQFTSNPVIRNIIGQPKSSFDLRDIMDKKKILIVNLSKGRVGEVNANLLGSILITKIYLAAMGRADAGDAGLSNLPNFYLYVDEFQSFANESFADILSEARKYKLNLTMAHQYIEQMAEEVRSAVFGNVGTMVTFRVGAYDAEVLEKEFAPVFTAEDLVNLGFTQIYLKLMIDGVSSAPFSATTIPPLPRTEENHVKEVIEASQEKYGKPRALVEETINNWYNNSAPDNGGGKEKDDKGSSEKKTYKDPRTSEKRSPGASSTQKSRRFEKTERPKEHNASEEDARKKASTQTSAEKAQPFKDAMKKALEEHTRQNGDSVDERKTIPLSELHKEKINKGNPTPEKTSALKDALNALIKHKPAQKQNQSSHSRREKQSLERKNSSQKMTEDNKQSTARAEKQSSSTDSKEVPEDVLEKIFAE